MRYGSERGASIRSRRVAGVRSKRGRARLFPRAFLLSLLLLARQASLVFVGEPPADFLWPCFWFARRGKTGGGRDGSGRLPDTLRRADQHALVLAGFGFLRHGGFYLHAGAAAAVPHLRRIAFCVVCTRCNGGTDVVRSSAFQNSLRALHPVRVIAM